MIIVLVQILLLIILSYQDFRNRSVSVIVLFTLGCIAFFNGILVNGFQQFLSYFSLNLLFLVFLLGSVTLYFLLKGNKLKSFYNTSLGSGDIIFFLLLSFMFSPVNFIILFVISLAFSLLIVILVKAFNVHWPTVPLVGTMSSFLIPVLLLFLIIGASGYSDKQLLAWLTPFYQ